MEELVEKFPEGTVIALDGNRVVGMGTGIFVDVDPGLLPSTEAELLDDENGSLHNMDGTHYFGGALAVHPEYRNQGIARQIYNRRKNLVIRYQKQGFYAASFLAGYENYKHELGIQEYVDKVVATELFDSSLSVQLRNGFSVVKILHRFFTSPRSDDWSALIYWGNPSWTDVTRKI
jgi:GNAT superfamily N-acetyltransferase